MTVLLDRPLPRAGAVAPDRPAPARPAARDPFLDLLRVFAIALVVLQHWTIPVLSFDGVRLSTGNALATPGVWAVTWISQVMPLVFFAGGAANAISLGRAAHDAPRWLFARLRRLAWPLLPLAAVWIPLPQVLAALGVPEQPLDVGARLTGQLLWFLAVYLIAVVATPWLLGLHRRHGAWVPVVLTAGAALTDLLRFSTGLDALGYLNIVFVWLAVHQLGLRYADGRLSRPWALAAGGFGAAALLVWAGPYPGSMIGLPGAEVSNMAPPTLAMLAVAFGQIGLAVTLRPWLARLPVGRLLAWAGPRVMTAYLWHMPALFAVTGVVVVGLGLDTPAPGGLGWFAGWPLWLGALCLVMWPLLSWFRRFEEPPALPYGEATWRGALTSAALVGGGLLTLTVAGFAPGGAPFLAILAILGGLLITGPRAQS
ncbi:acyltransferase family protein [Nonomuraea cavernae]|uniref:Acyltransferase n=1 Tax=Nonomuraea cavernae TaxID=2045107 RepID=A0A917ZEK5_9ACTN|nr:acyltransferase [Nonomuraea cavernae]MCA2190253.1 acyltransferase [Nonomuraea cavernae]GGO80417.1 acyltransferase [Nonomuraea cavernae]